MSNSTLNLTPSVYEYLLDVSLRESPILRALREATQTLSEHNMQISPEQGQFMAMIARLMQAKNVLEVGTFTGYSALVVAEALPEEGRIVCCDLSETFTDIAKRFWDKAQQAHKITLKLQPAMNTLDELVEQGQSGSFDMAFIDADKTHYHDYYERCLQLVRQGGVIMIDNVLWSGQVADLQVKDEDTESIRQLNAHIAKDPRVDLSMVPIGDGLTLARKK
jgi:predicted O-methyltransferase YrrM